MPDCSIRQVDATIPIRTRRSVYPLIAAILTLAAIAGPAVRADDPAGALLRIGPNDPDGKPLERVRSLALSPDATRIATTGEPSDPKQDRLVRIWDAADGTLLHTLTARDQIVGTMDFSPDGKLLVTVSADHPAGTQVWDVEQGTLVASASGGSGFGQFTSDGQLLVVERFGARDAALLLDPRTGVEARRFPIRTHVRATFTPDGRRALFVERPRTPTIHANDIETDTRLARLEATDGEPRAVALSPRGRTAAAIDGSDVVLWEIATATRYWGVGPVGKPEGVVHRLAGHEGSVFRLQFTTDGRRLVTSSADKTVRVWDVASGKELSKFEGHESLVTSLAVSADGTRVASGSFDRTVHVWDTSKLVDPLAAAAPTEDELDKLWTDLGSTEPAKAYRAMGLLRAHPKNVVAVVASRVHGTLVPAENDRIRELVVELDDPDFRVRHRATLELEKLRGIARPILVKTYQTSFSEEVRNRIRRILKGDENVPRYDETDRRRMLRIVHAAEAVAAGSIGETRAAALAVIEEIVAEFPDETIVAEAKRILARLKR